LICTISALNYIGIHYQYNKVHYKYTQMHWKKIQILWCLIKYIYLSLKIHCYVLIYICIPSKYIIVPSKNLTYFWHILQYHYYIPIFLHIHWNYHETSIPHLFVLSLPLFFKIVLAPHYSTKMSRTCHDIFVGIQKSSIFHEFYTPYWLIKYLNPKVISRDSINTYWTYIHR
jgi:hypothetical protein